MTVEEFASVLDLHLEINFRQDEPADSNSRFYALYRGVDVMGDRELISSYGNGKTPEEAVVNYGKEIAGKRLVVNASSANRLEFNAPANLGK